VEEEEDEDQDEGMERGEEDDRGAGDEGAAREERETGVEEGKGVTAVVVNGAVCEEEGGGDGGRTKVRRRCRVLCSSTVEISCMEPSQSGVKQAAP
jgi:hypothetical protein